MRSSSESDTAGWRGFHLLIFVASFGDISVGVASQCLKSSKCFRAKAQYYANVMLKYVLICALTSR